jgi:hypothetical protein
MISELFYFNSFDIVRKYITINNILIFKDDLINVIEFGTSKQVENTFESINFQEETLSYMSR